MDSLKSNIEEIPKEITTETYNGEDITPTETTTNENTIATAAATAEIETEIDTKISNSNQETDLAAMSKDLEESLQTTLPIQLQNTTTTNSSLSELATTATSYNSSNTIATNNTDSAPATNSSETTETTTTNATISATSSNQFVTPQKPDNKSIQLHASTSLKKKRNKFSRCLNGNNDDGVYNNGGGIQNGDAGVHDSSSSLSNVLPQSSIKTSLSMTSLPPDEKQENRDGIKAKLKVERPYNSLKVSLVNEII